MPDDVGFSRPPQNPNYSKLPPGRKSGRTAKRMGALALAALILGVCSLVWKRNLFAPPPRGALLHSPRIPEFSAFKKLDDFVGVECFYTSKFTEPLAVVGESKQVDLLPMSKVLVKKVVLQTADYDHPESKGYRLYLMTRDLLAMRPHTDVPGQSTAKLPPLPVLNTLVLLYPTIGNNGEIIDLPLCPVSSCKKARELWLEKQFKFNGDKINEVELERGTAVVVTDVEPAGLGTSGMRFDLTFKLPSGATATATMGVDEIVEALQPMGP